MVVNSATMLRRVDSDFVNITPVADFLSITLPRLSKAVVVENESSCSRGTWVPLETAQELAKDHPLLAVFVSDRLYDRFPSRVHDLRTMPHDQSIDRFGPPFASNPEVKRRTTLTRRLEFPPREAGAPWERGMVSHWDVEEHLLSAHFSSSVVNIASPERTAEADTVVPETPLSPTEEEMFRVLCSNPDWETAPSRESSPVVEVVPLPEDASERSTQVVRELACLDRPLRRSKRVANAIVAAAVRPRTRSSKRGSRSSLS